MEIFEKKNDIFIYKRVDTFGKEAKEEEPDEKIEFTHIVGAQSDPSKNEDHGWIQ